MRENDAALEAFMEDFSSRVWLTYRREFEEFQGTSINTDCGWGCMIRLDVVTAIGCL
jgi:cysteine protease ATG4